jgi:hypothetical protein
MCPKPPFLVRLWRAYNARTVNIATPFAPVSWGGIALWRGSGEMIVVPRQHSFQKRKLLHGSMPEAAPEKLANSS